MSKGSGLNLIARYRRYRASDEYYVERFWDIDHAIWLDRAEYRYDDNLERFQKRLASNVTKARMLRPPDQGWDECFDQWIQWTDWWFELGGTQSDEWWEEHSRRRTAWVECFKRICDARHVPLMLYGGEGPWEEDLRQAALGMPPHR